LERVDRPVRETFRHPATNWPTAQPLILKKTKTRKIVVGLNLFTRIPIEVLREVQPEGTTRFRIKVPRNNFTNPGVKRFLSANCFCHIYGKIYLDTVSTTSR